MGNYFWDLIVRILLLVIMPGRLMSYELFESSHGVSPVSVSYFQDFEVSKSSMAVWTQQSIERYKYLSDRKSVAVCFGNERVALQAQDSENTTCVISLSDFHNVHFGNIGYFAGLEFGFCLESDILSPVSQLMHRTGNAGVQMFIKEQECKMRVYLLMLGNGISFCCKQKSPKIKDLKLFEMVNKKKEMGNSNHSNFTLLSQSFVEKMGTPVRPDSTEYFDDVVDQLDSMFLGVEKRVLGPVRGSELRGSYLKTQENETEEKKLKLSHVKNKSVRFLGNGETFIKPEFRYGKLTKDVCFTKEASIFTGQSNLSNNSKKSYQ